MKLELCSWYCDTFVNRSIFIFTFLVSTHNNKNISPLFPFKDLSLSLPPTSPSYLFLNISLQANTSQANVRTVRVIEREIYILLILLHNKDCGSNTTHSKFSIISFLHENIFTCFEKNICCLQSISIIKSSSQAKSSKENLLNHL